MEGEAGEDGGAGHGEAVAYLIGGGCQVFAFYE